MGTIISNNVPKNYLDDKVSEINTEVAKKVDKVTGKGLSTNDLTDSLLTKFNKKMEYQYAVSDFASLPTNASNGYVYRVLSDVEYKENVATFDESREWRVPTYYEWDYLLKQRPNALKLRALYARGSLYGMMILPDNMADESGTVTMPEGLSFTYTNDISTYNYISTSDYTKLKECGVVFLPYGGMYYNGKATNYTSQGYYWSSTQKSNGKGFNIVFTKGTILTDGANERYQGLLVRLVKNNDEGLFSVSSDTKVSFSPACLRYNASSGYFFFGDELRTVGYTNNYKSQGESGTMDFDLFGWGTSGYNDCKPWTYSTNNSDYPDMAISNTNYDWGKNNDIFLGSLPQVTGIYPENTMFVFNNGNWFPLGGLVRFIKDKEIDNIIK